MRKKIIFVSDYYSDKLLGGAELTNDALIESCPFEIEKVDSIRVSERMIFDNLDSFWLFTNFARMKYVLLDVIKNNLKYGVIEYDYKYCMNRSPQACHYYEGRYCDCDKHFGLEIAKFYEQAEFRAFMSRRQKMIYLDLFPFLDDYRNMVISSLFKDEDFDYIRDLNQQGFNKSDEYLIVPSDSWVKGMAETIQYCKENNIKYKLLNKMPNKELLKEFVKAKGLVYMPNGYDTCPRTTIEAKLLGCDLITNERVQHKNEDWFNSNRIEEYLKFMRKRVWNFIEGCFDAYDKESLSV